MKPVKLVDQEQTKCANELITLIEETLGDIKYEIDENERTLTIKANDDVDDFSAHWIRSWTRKTCFAGVYDYKKGVKVNDNQIKIFFLKPVKIK